ncbi:MAG: hypothetical protein ACLPR9_10305 [Acidimicrobiales bacterium]|jgi:hypothetical protein
MVFHEVDDVDHWLAAPTREAVFGPMGITIRTFVDPEKSNRVGLIVDVPDMAAFREVMASTVAADAMSSDGVRPETLVMLVEG